MHGLFGLLSALALAPAPMVPDTPPALPIPVEKLAELKSNTAIVAASRLADGSRAPDNLVLPQLANTREVLKHMMEHYPLSLRDRYDVEMPWVWIYIDARGRAGQARIVKPSGQPAFDSLALAALEIARFTPAAVNDTAVGVWTPLPIQAVYRDIAERAPKEDPKSDSPRFTPYTEKPTLLNRAEVSTALVRSYPPSLRDAGVGGEVLLWLFIDESGRTAKVEIKGGLGNIELNKAAIAVARVMRWTPARNQGQNVGVWIVVPIVFKAAPPRSS